LLASRNAQSQPFRAGPPAGSGLAVSDLDGRIDADRPKKVQILQVHAKRGALLVRRWGAFPGGSAAARAAELLHADLGVEHHVVVVALVADPLDGVVHAAGPRDRLVVPLSELLQHLAQMVVQFHDRRDYRFRFREASRLPFTIIPCYTLRGSRRYASADPLS